MFISDFAIKRPVVTIVVMVVLVLFGGFALWQTALDEYPTITQPVVNVTIAYPGAVPSQVEADVLNRLEDQINAISGVDKIMSQAVDGFASITVEFIFSKDVNVAMQEVRDAVSAARGELPAAIKEPIYRKYDPDAKPIVSLVLSSRTRNVEELTAIADPGIVNDLRGINGVAQATVSGGATRTLTVNVRPPDLAAAGLTMETLVAAVQAQNVSSPAGRLQTTWDEQAIRFQGRLADAPAFARVVAAERGGRIIRVGDVADVSDGSEEQRTAASYNGHDAVGIDVRKGTDASTTAVADAVVSRLDSVRAGLPRDVQLDVVTNAAVRVRASVRNVEDTLVEGAILTVLVVFVFLNSWRSTVITGLALPVSVIAAFIGVWAFGFTLNMMSLLGISLAIGILVDDAIVVRENIVRHIQRGEDHVTASHQGTDEIGLAVTATTFSIVAVFVPVSFMAGVPGQFFKPFALTIVVAVLVSLFVSFSLDPMLSAHWPDPEHEPGAGPRARGRITRLLDTFNGWFDRQTERYARLVGWALDHRWTMIALAGASFVVAIGLQATIGGTGFVPGTDRSELSIGVDAPPGSSLEYTRTKAEQIAQLVRARAEVRSTYTTVGSGNGSGEVDQATVFVSLVPKSARRLSQDAMASRLREDIQHVVGVTAYVYANGLGAGAGKAIEVNLHGEDADALQQAANRVLKAIRNVSGAVDAGLSTKGERPEVIVTLDRDMAGTLGVTASQVAQSLRPAFAGIDAGDWVDPTGKTRYVKVRLAPAARRSASDLAQLPLVLAGSGMPTIVPLGQVATVTDTVGPARIDHLNREKVVTVGANVAGRPLGAVSSDIDGIVSGLRLPPGVRSGQGGDGEQQARLFASMATALATAALLMYFILVVQFGSFLDPLAIMLSLPLSSIGIVLALLATGDTLNVMSLIGVILLMGLVAKNAILLIDFAKWEVERGTPLRDALIEAGRVRLRPIMMTTVALVAGMVPVALGIGEGADFRAPLGRAVIGGVIASTVLTLVVIPTVYEILDGWRRWLGARLGASRGISAHAGPVLAHTNAEAVT
jgi:HAE1 family hydrophobic/amphiphilic exporter-1